MVQTWGEKIKFEIWHPIPSPCGVSHHAEAFWITEHPSLPCNSYSLPFHHNFLCPFAVTIFHFWQCPYSLSTCSCSLLLFCLSVLDSAQSLFFFPLPDLHSSQVDLIYPLSHLCARGLILLFSFFSTHLWPSSSTFLLFHITAGSAFLLSSLKLSHLSPSSFPNPFLPTNFQILLPFHYFVFPPPSPPSWASYQHFFCTLSSTSTSSSPYHGAGAHQGSTGESLPFIFSSI